MTKPPTKADVQVEAQKSGKEDSVPAGRDGIVTFLFGAGLMYGRLPIAVQLTDRLREHLHSLEKEGKGARGARLLAVCRYLDGALRFQRGIRNRDPGEPVNIEEIASAALGLAERDALLVAPHVSGWHPRLLELLNDAPTCLAEFIDAVYAKLSDWLSLPSDANVSYLQNLDRLVSRYGPLEVFTLNYDLGVETAMQRLGEGGVHIPVATGFTVKGWEPESLDECRGIRLHKLHGSLDWVEDEEIGLCSLAFPTHEAIELVEGTHRPLLIFGTDAKLNGREPFLSLLYRFSHRLAHTDVLVVIGYSFGDQYINDIIRQRMSNNLSMRLLIIDPCAEKTARRFVGEEKNARVVPWQEKAEEVLINNTLLARLEQLQGEIARDTPFV